ncbi:glycosyltransferase family 4 protein [Nitrolancea hollandica]|uniref:Putative Glycosyl transferase group 1 n=1 Tax=Nitrolancea hollandica Lb TaxID=1129897 RepID=I4EHZ8_9BACT|nr:glycosyltransferase family 1 protein [Nitrolancea hollandica]CCF84310.1 putative Glycosyl transferase group 1 [Nitrolancea hollandica Lb]
MARIGISGLFVRPTQVGGAEYMLNNLLHGLASVKRPDDDIVLFTNHVTYSKNQFRGLRYAESVRTPFINRFIQESFCLPGSMGEFDSFLFPNYFTPPRRVAGKIVTVIHDLQYLHFPLNFSPKKRIWLRAAHELTLHQADVVVAISNFVRDDLIRHYGDRHAGKIHFIPNPISWERLSHEKPSLVGRVGIPDSPYILSVAAHYAHKNLETLIRAFARVHQTRTDYKLVLVGQLPTQLVGVSRHARVTDLIYALGIESSVLVTGHIPEAALGALYRNATIFVFPSLFEGFGMPPVEALGMGLPVLTTRCGSLPEVTQGLAAFVSDPLDAEEMADFILTMMETPGKYTPSADLVARLRDTYAPERVAREYYTLLTP